jgi:putative tryptophan/tyrosine transport system substrate-binding protein
MIGLNKMRWRSILATGVLLGLLMVACGDEKSKTYSVGVINIVPDFDKIMAGFKKGVAELGYIEGENIRYIYDGPTTDMSRLETVAQSLLAADVDLILSMTTPATNAAKKVTAGTNLPVIFVPVTDPVGAGIVDSIKYPGGNITGVAFGLQEVRRLEWLVRIAPKIKRIFVPFNPGDKSPVLALAMVRNTAAKLGIELITAEIRNPEMLSAAIDNIPAQADAVFLLPDSLVSTRLVDLVAAATKRKLPVSGANVTVVRNSGVLTTFGIDISLAGKQAARLVDQIFQGVKPADLPVEMAEFYLAINLKVAKAIDLDIPDEILRQADIIIR